MKLTVLKILCFLSFFFFFFFQDCKSFRVGNSCCEFICLDDTLPKSDGNPENSTDFGLRVIASAITAILFLSLFFFLIHRLRQRKIRGRQNRQLTEDQRSLGSIGYIAGSIGYLPGSMGYLGNQEHLDFAYDSDPRSNFALWKPPENYFPRGEAPPPYEEAVAAAHAEAMAAAMHLAASSAQHNCVTIALVPSSTTGTLHRDRPHRQISEAIPTLSSLPPPPEPPPDISADVLQAIRSDAFYEDVQLAPPPSLVEYVNVEQTRAPELASAACLLLDPMSSNLTAMNDLNKSTCSCPDENDDYRSECENCKSTHGSRYLDQEPNMTPHETMTLQRRPPSLTPNTANGYGTSLTLPSQSRRLRLVTTIFKQSGNALFKSKTSIKLKYVIN
jgi:hypothetical protein